MAREERADRLGDCRSTNRVWRRLPGRPRLLHRPRHRPGGGPDGLTDGHRVRVICGQRRRRRHRLCAEIGEQLRLVRRQIGRAEHREASGHRNRVSDGQLGQRPPAGRGEKRMRQRRLDFTSRRGTDAVHWFDAVIDKLRGRRHEQLPGCIQGPQRSGLAGDDLLNRADLAGARVHDLRVEF